MITDDDIDALYSLPVEEFTAARNALAKRLKASGEGKADLVKALPKPSISAWAVNQLYWKHREEFDRLIAAGESVRQAQTSSRSMADMRPALDARREALSNASDLATALLRDAGHKPTLDIVRRVTATLEAMSVGASVPGSPEPGRLSHDVDPPGFESLASLFRAAGTTKPAMEQAQITQSPQSGRAATTGMRLKEKPGSRVPHEEDAHQASMAAARGSLERAKSLLIEARARSRSLEAAQKKADTAARDAEKHKREAEERFEKARATWQEAAGRAQSVAVEAAEAAKAAEDAQSVVEKASKELEKLSRTPLK